MDFKSKRKASRLRAASRWFGYGGVVVAIGLLAVWYFLEAKDDVKAAIDKLLEQVKAVDIANISIYVLAAAGVLVLGIVLGIILRCIAHHYAVLGRNLIPTGFLPRKIRKKVNKAQKGISKKAYKYTKHLG